MSAPARERRPDRDAEPEVEPVRLADRLALRPREAAAALGLSERAFRSLLPQLPHVRAGGCVLVPVDALRGWLEERVRAGSTSAGRLVPSSVSAIVNNRR